MARKTRIADLPDFDMARQLKSEEDIAAYITMVIEEATPRNSPMLLVLQPRRGE